MGFLMVDANTDIYKGRYSTNAIKLVNEGHTENC